MKKLTALLLIVCICLSLSACGNDTQTGGNNGGGGNATKENSKEISPGVVMIDDCKIAIGEKRQFVGNNVTGQAYVALQVKYTNNSDQERSLKSVAKIRVYQNGVECKESRVAGYNTNGYTGNEDILPGNSQTLLLTYEIKKLNEPVLIKILDGSTVISEFTYTP